MKPTTSSRCISTGSMLTNGSNCAMCLISFEITGMQPVKIKEDAFYNSITMRIGAQGHDYTIDQAGRVVSGSQHRLRRWSEYWTFIRNRQAQRKQPGPT